MKYEFIQKQRLEIPVRVLCEVLEVRERGFYKWRKCQGLELDRHQKADEELSVQLKKVFEQSRQTYGSPRLHAALRRQGVSCSRHRVARLMRKKGLVACWRRKKRRVVTTDSPPSQPFAPNRLERDLTAEAVNQKWVGDITGVWTEEGWLYLAAMEDLYSRRIIGGSMSEVRDERLVEDALWRALIRRQPTGHLLHHTDRGSQYTSRSYKAVLEHYGIELSMSRKGNCWDNAVMESFFATLKAEGTDRRSFASRHEAKTVIFEYIDVFYNRQRLHSSLGYESPESFEKPSDLLAL
jgi:transposase InsO family protein